MEQPAGLACAPSSLRISPAPTCRRASVLCKQVAARPFACDHPRPRLRCCCHSIQYEMSSGEMVQKGWGGGGVAPTGGLLGGSTRGSINSRGTTQRPLAPAAAPPQFRLTFTKCVLPSLTNFVLSQPVTVPALRSETCRIPGEPDSNRQWLHAVYLLGTRVFSARLSLESQRARDAKIERCPVAAVLKGAQPAAYQASHCHSATPSPRLRLERAAAVEAHHPAQPCQPAACAAFCGRG